MDGFFHAFPRRRAKAGESGASAAVARACGPKGRPVRGHLSVQLTEPESGVRRPP